MKYIKHPDDCKRIQEVCLSHCWDISLCEADVMWGRHSMGQSCVWSFLPTTQQAIWEIIEPLLDRLMAGEGYQPDIGQSIHPKISIQQTTIQETMEKKEQITPQAEQPQEPADHRFKLTMEILNNPDNRGKVIAKGEIVNGSKGLLMTSSNAGMMLKWVLKMGGGYGDWAVYCHWATHSDQFILENGDKVTMKSNLIKIIDLDDECWKKYRS